MLADRILPRLGWWPPPLTTPILLEKLSVGLATWMQLRVVREDRAQLHAEYVREAGGAALPQQGPVGAAAAAAPPAHDDLGDFQSALARMWQDVRWEHENKETLWRLAIDGIPLPGNSHLRGMAVEACGCGEYAGDTAAGAEGAAAPTPRQHHFWDCPVARAVVSQIEGHVGAPVSRRQVWLARAPVGVVQGVWDVVSLAALSAMEAGRRYLRARTRAAEAQPTQQQQQEAAGPTALERARSIAIADFWARLKGFAALGVPKKGWRQVGPHHPLLAVAGGRVRCANPVGFAAAEDNPGADPAPGADSDSGDEDG